MKKWIVALLTVFLFLSLVVPVWADNGEGQVVFPGGSIVIGPGEELRGDLTVMGGHLELRAGGRIIGDVVVLGGSAVIDGRIDDNLVVMGGTLDLKSHAVVGGNLVTFGGTMSRAEGAIVRGQVIEGFKGRLPLSRIWPFSPGWWWSGQTWRRGGDVFFNFLASFMLLMFKTLALMALGVLLVVLIPKPTTMVGQAVSEAPLASLGVGLLTFLVLLILVPLLVIICIGIPVAVLLVLAAVAAATFGSIAIGTVVGQRLLIALKAEPLPLLQVIIGIAVMMLLSAVPCLGWLLGLIISAAGLGAVVLTRFGTMPYQPVRREPTPPQPPPPPESDVQGSVAEKTQD